MDTGKLMRPNDGSAVAMVSVAVIRSPNAPANGLGSAKFQTMGMAWRPKSRSTRVCESCHRQRLLHVSVVRLTERAKYVPTASPYAVAPVPPSRRNLASFARPAATASRCTRSRACCTKSEKVVSATIWRGVKRSPHVESPYGTQVPPVSRAGTSPSGRHSGKAMRAVCSWTDVGAR